LKRLKKYN